MSNLILRWPPHTNLLDTNWVQTNWVANVKVPYDPTWSNSWWKIEWSRDLTTWGNWRNNLFGPPGTGVVDVIDFGTKAFYRSRKQDAFEP